MANNNHTKSCTDMTKSDYIALCHYYKGEKKNSYEGSKDKNKAMLWELEKMWVKVMLDPAANMVSAFDEYKAKGLLNFAEDNVPEHLKAFIFNDFMKTSFDGNPQPFIDFYHKYYK